MQFQPMTSRKSAGAFLGKCLFLMEKRGPGANLFLFSPSVPHDHLLLLPCRSYSVDRMPKAITTIFQPCALCQGQRTKKDGEDERKEPGPYWPHCPFFPALWHAFPWAFGQWSVSSGERSAFPGFLLLAARLFLWKMKMTHPRLLFQQGLHSNSLCSCGGRT